MRESFSHAPDATSRAPHDFVKVILNPTDISMFGDTTHRGKNERIAPRQSVPICLNVTVSVDGALEVGHLFDISTGGFAVLLKMPLKRNQIARAELDLRTAGRIDTLAYPRHIARVSTHYRIGFAFALMAKKDCALLSSAIDIFRRNGAVAKQTMVSTCGSENILTVAPR